MVARAVEIQDLWAAGMLAPKLQPHESLGPKASPKGFFSISAVAS